MTPLARGGACCFSCVGHGLMTRLAGFVEYFLDLTETADRVGHDAQIFAVEARLYFFRLAGFVVTGFAGKGIFELEGGIPAVSHYVFSGVLFVQEILD